MRRRHTASLSGQEDLFGPSRAQPRRYGSFSGAFSRVLMPSAASVAADAAAAAAAQLCPEQSSGGRSVGRPSRFQPPAAMVLPPMGMPALLIPTMGARSPRNSSAGGDGMPRRSPLGMDPSQQQPSFWGSDPDAAQPLSRLASCSSVGRQSLEQAPFPSRLASTSFTSRHSLDEPAPARRWGSFSGAAGKVAPAGLEPASPSRGSCSGALDEELLDAPQSPVRRWGSFSGASSKVAPAAMEPPSSPGRVSPHGRGSFSGSFFGRPSSRLLQQVAPEPQRSASCSGTMENYLFAPHPGPLASSQQYADPADSFLTAAPHPQLRHGGLAAHTAVLSVRRWGSFSGGTSSHASVSPDTTYHEWRTSEAGAHLAATAGGHRATASSASMSGTSPVRVSSEPNLGSPNSLSRRRTESGGIGSCRTSGGSFHAAPRVHAAPDGSAQLFANPLSAHEGEPAVHARAEPAVHTRIGAIL